MNTVTAQSPTTSMRWLVHTLVLSYGGVLVLQWFHDTIFGGMATMTRAGIDQWLRDATLALPFVAGAVLLGRRRRDGGAAGVAVLFAATMGIAALFHQAPPGMGMVHEGPTFDSGVILQRMVLVMLLAGAFALVTERALTALDGVADQLGAWLPVQPRRASLAGSLVAVLLLTPTLVLGTSGRAVAQTSFPDQVIHPHDTLLLVARQLQDGTMAYVAPDYGDKGVRPIIEMTEGETLNITLRNELNADVSLHVHGVLYSLASDGTRHNNSFARPGTDYTYQWRAAPGTAGYWHYHDHVFGDDEGTQGIAGGLYGGLVVRKPGAPQPVRTFLIVFHNFSINGRLYPDTPMPTAYEGELVEFLVVTYMDTLHTFHLHGHRWLTPSRGGTPDPADPANVGSGREDNHIMAPGDSFGFVTIAGDGVGPGMWMYHCHVQSHSAGMRGFFHVLPKP